MDFQPIINLIAQTGIWCVLAFGLGKILFDWMKKFFEYIKEEKERDRADFKQEKDRIYSLFDNQAEISSQQKDLLQQHLIMAEHNKEMLDRLTDIQMLHTNRLDRIEDRQSRLETEVREMNKNIIENMKRG